MGIPFHNQVKLWGFVVEDAQFTWNISGVPAPTYYPGQLVEPLEFPWLSQTGLAMTQDLTQPNTMKPCGAGDRIFGKLMTLNPISDASGIMGTVASKFADFLPIDPAGTVPAVGDTVMGSSGGTVTKATTNDPGVNYVADIVAAPARAAPITQYAVVVKL